MRIIYFIALLGALTFALAQDIVPVDQSYTSKNRSPNIIELEHHYQINSKANLSYIYPTIKKAFSSDFSVYDAKLRFNDSLGMVGFTPLLDLEYRYLDEYKDHVKAISVGGIIYGNLSLMSFMLDARMFTEMRTSDESYSYDKGVQDTQTEGVASRVNYTSYSRYIANLNFATSFGDIGFNRSALHWGPGIFHNLVFNQEAVPFNTFYYNVGIGPFRIITTWGRLSIDGNSSYRKSDSTRSVYAHRYEWSITKDLLLGVSEQLICYNTEEPAALIPIVPLFMEKGEGVERKNNGNIAVDLSYRFQKIGSIYTEFLIDDVSEPSSMFNDYWGNKWAWMVGGHYAKNYKHYQFGFISEYSRIEPWVYTHYTENTTQSANRSYPIGNQLGPNSQAYTNKIYFRNGLDFYAGLRVDLVWKGDDFGSDINDPSEEYTDRNTTPKKFLDGIDSPDIWISPEISYTHKYFNVQTSLERKDDDFTYIFRTQFFY